jgi:hypothetical protein
MRIATRTCLAVLPAMLIAPLHAADRWHPVMTGMAGEVKVEKFLDKETIKRQGDVVEVQLLDNRSKAAPFVSAVDRYKIDCAAGSLLPRGSTEYAGPMASGKVVKTTEYTLPVIQPPAGSATEVIVKAVCAYSKTGAGTKR